MSQAECSFNAANQKKVEAYLASYPEKMAALLPVLHLAQAQFGYLSQDVIAMVADLLEVTPSHVYGTASFYDMFKFEPPAKHEFVICRNISCYLHNCEQLKAKLKEKLKIGADGRSADGKFALVEAECLAACDKAPVMMVDQKLYTHVHDLPEELQSLLKEPA